MERLLKAQSWQIFILLIAGIMISNITVHNSPLTNSFIRIIGCVIFFLYPFALGCTLTDYLPGKVKLRENFYLINTFIWVSAFSIISVLSDGKGMVFNGLAAIPMIYVFFAFLYFMSFPAKALKSIELNKEAIISEYIGDFFLILFLPVGIWFIQPRIRQIIIGGKIINEIQEG